MENVITSIKEALGDLKLIQNLFEDNEKLDYLHISFYKDTDDSELITRVDKLIINSTEFVPEYPGDYFSDLEEIMDSTPEPYDCDGVIVDIDFIATLDETIWSLIAIHSSDSDELVFERESVLALKFQNLNTFL